jgi:hypothetical protein
VAGEIGVAPFGIGAVVARAHRALVAAGIEKLGYRYPNYCFYLSVAAPLPIGSSVRTILENAFSIPVECLFG